MSDQDKEAPDAAENTETEPPTETSPALPPTKNDKTVDQISSTIGEVGRWQLEKILIVFLASAPGNADYYLLDHLYMELLYSQVYLTFSMRVSSLRSRSSGASKR